VEDLGALVAFLRVTPFNNPKIFTDTFVLPIQKDQPQGWARLTSLVKCISLRRTKEAEKGNLQLPAREEVVQPVRLNERERAIYDTIVRMFRLGLTFPTSSTKSRFQTILRLRQVCNHGADLLPAPLQAWLAPSLRLVDIPPPEVLNAETCENCDDLILGKTEYNGPEGSANLLPCLHSICVSCLDITKRRYIDEPSDAVCPICSSDGATSATQNERHGRPRDTPSCYVASSKVKAVLENLTAAGMDSDGNKIKRYCTCP
jgi:SNF2 family DNA or RNA helicase